MQRIFPKEICNIIEDYKCQLEHVEKFQTSLEEIPQMYHVIMKLRLHNEFRMFLSRFTRKHFLGPTTPRRRTTKQLYDFASTLDKWAYLTVNQTALWATSLSSNPTVLKILKVAKAAKVVIAV